MSARRSIEEVFKEKDTVIVETQQMASLRQTLCDDIKRLYVSAKDEQDFEFSEDQPDFMGVLGWTTQ